MEEKLNTRYFMLDLKNDPELIAAYIDKHKPGNVWPEIIEAILQKGIINMEIFQNGNRLFMVLQESNLPQESIPPENKEKEARWEEAMWQFQQAIPWAKKGEKWVELQSIFKLHDHE